MSDDRALHDTSQDQSWTGGPDTRAQYGAADRAREPVAEPPASQTAQDALIPSEWRYYDEMDTSPKCYRCGKPAKQMNLPDGRKRWCSRECVRAHARDEYRAINPQHGLSTATVGAIAELAVAADLLQRGYDVFRAVSASCSCDLAILRSGALLRVEVRSASQSPTGGAYFSLKPRDIGRHDVLAIRHKDGRIEYRPELPTEETE